MPSAASRRTVVLLALLVAASLPGRATHAQGRGHMPETVPGHIVRQLLEFSPLPALMPDSQPLEVYLDPVPEGFLRLQLPPGVRPAAALRNGLGRAVFIPMPNGRDSTVGQLSRHLRELGWTMRGQQVLELRPRGPGEGVYCRRNAAILLAGDTAPDGYVILARVAPIFSVCLQSDTNARGMPESFIQAIENPPGSTRTGTGTAGSGIMQEWHAEAQVAMSVRAYADYYAAALERQGFSFGPVVFKGDTLTRTAKRVDRYGTVWTGELRAEARGDARRVTVRLNRELEPEER